MFAMKHLYNTGKILNDTITLKTFSSLLLLLLFLMKLWFSDF